MGSQDRLGWGFIGASTIAEEWMIDAVNAHPDSRVVAIASRSAERADALARRHGIPGRHDGVAALLADPAVDVAYVSTTNERHHEAVLLAAAAGKHVLCEKPLALELDQALAMVTACRGHGVVMATNHHLRNAATHRVIRRLVADGAIGTPLSASIAHAVYLPPSLRTWRVHDARAGGGVILDIAVHDIDTLRFLLDREPVAVTAEAGNAGMASDGLEDNAMAVIRFADGLLAQIHLGYAFPHAETGLEIQGTLGSITARNVMSQSPVGTVTLRRDGRDERLAIAHENLYARAVRCFNEAVRGRGRPAATGEDGVRSLAAALAMRAAAASGRRTEIPPVTLPPR